MLKMSVDIFSGRTNPSWVLSHEDTHELLKEVKSNRDMIAEGDLEIQGLGYRGITIDILSDELSKQYDVSSRFQIANGTSKHEKKGFEVARRYIKAMAKYIPEKKVRPDFRLDESIQPLILEQMAVLEQRIAKLPIWPPWIKSARDCFRIEFKQKCEIELGWFHPNYWNQDPTIQYNNNCYNYATNRRTDTFAQPGRASGSYPYSLNCQEVTEAALSDGVHKRCDCFPDSERPRWFIVMVIWPGWDYHWYRKHLEGFWGHKPGSTAVRNTDNSDVVISNPKTCDRGPYTDFCGYFYTCKSMVVE